MEIQEDLPKERFFNLLHLSESELHLLKEFAAYFADEELLLESEKAAVRLVEKISKILGKDAFLCKPLGCFL